MSEATQSLKKTNKLLEIASTSFIAEWAKIRFFVGVMAAFKVDYGVFMQNTGHYACFSLLDARKFWFFLILYHIFL